MNFKVLGMLLPFLFFTNDLLAQTSNVVFFNDDGQKFTVTLNGLKQNKEPLSNVKITGLNQPAYKAKITFENPDISEIDKTFYVRPGTETVVKIKQNRKGNYVLRGQSQIPIAQIPPPPPHQRVIVYGGGHPPLPPTPNYPPPAQTTVSRTTTTRSTGLPGQNMHVHMNAGGLGVNMNVNAGLVGATTTTTTTTTGGYNPGYPPPSTYRHHSNRSRHSQYANGCYGPMSPSDFSSAKQSISNQSFSDDKLKIAKQILRTNCMSSGQVKQILGLFSFESTRLDFAKFAYGRTTDPQNFYKLNDAFSFSSSVDELDNYIRSFGRGR